MAGYGHTTDLRLSFSGKNDDELQQVTALFADNFTLKRLLPLNGPDHNGARRTTWGVLRDVRNISRHPGSIRFESDGVPSAAFDELSRRFPSVKFRLEYWCAEGNFYGCASYHDGKTQDYRFNNPGSPGLDRNRIALTPGCILRVDGEKKPLIYRGGVRGADNAPTEVEAVALDGTLRRVEWSKVEWKAAT